MKFFLLGIIFSLSIVATINYSVDVENSYWRRQKFPAQIIPENKVLLVPGNRKERDDRVSYLKSNPIGKYLILGSSRSLRWGSPEAQWKKSSTNLSVSTVSVEEISALYEVVQQSGELPEKIILSLDPWMINEFSEGDDSEWLERTGFYEQFKNRISGQQKSHWSFGSQLAKKIKNTQEYLKGLISYQRLGASIKYTREHDWLNENFYVFVNSSEAENFYSIRPDGTLIYPKPYVQRAQTEIDQEAAKTPDPKADYMFKNFNVSVERQKIISSLLADAKNKNIDVVIVSPPFHPLTYERMQSLPFYKQALQDWQKWLAQLSANNKVCDLVDPKVSGCGNDGFMDAMHVNESCIKKMFKICNVE